MTAQILIVDDEPAAIQALHQALAGLADMRFATGGANALALLAAHRFDLVLLDAHMPGLDGYATCRALQPAPVSAVRSSPSCSRAAPSRPRPRSPRRSAPPCVRSVSPTHAQARPPRSP